MIKIDSFFKKNVGERLKNLRLKNKLTRRSLSEKIQKDFYLNIDPKTIERYESGAFLPKIDNLICLSELFNTTLDYIIFGRETSDDNSFTRYDNFKRLNRLIYSLAGMPWKNSEDGKIYLELWDDEAKIYYEKLQSSSVYRNYMFEHFGKDCSFSVQDLDNLFLEFKENKKQLGPNEERISKYLRIHGINPDQFKRQRIKEIKEKREV